MNSKKSTVRYGDYVFVKLSKAESPHDEFVISANGFYSANIWAGEEANLNVRSFRSSLFQIFPNQHIAKDANIKQTETQFNLLKMLNPDNIAGTRFFMEEIKKEKNKENRRAEKVEFLKQKEISETFGHPVLYGGKFTLKHVESGMFLESSPKSHPFGIGCYKVKLTNSPNSEMHFQIMPSLAHRLLGETVFYGEPILIYTPQLNNFLHFGDVQPLSPSSFLNPNPILDNHHFPPFPRRRRKPVLENKTTKVVGCSLTNNTAILMDYNHFESDFLKTGDYIRIFHDHSCLTIYEQLETRIMFESYESAEYRHQLANTIFQIARVPSGPKEFPREEIVRTLSSEKIGISAAENKADLYLLRHFVTGKYLALSDQKDESSNERGSRKQHQLQLVEISDTKAAPQGKFPYIQIVAEPHEGTEQVHKSAVFRIRFVGEAFSAFLMLGDGVDVGNQKRCDAEDSKSRVPEDYLIDKLKPKQYHVVAEEELDILRSSLKFWNISSHEIHYILKAESLANKFNTFLDFCFDFKTPLERAKIAEYEEKQKLDEITRLSTGIGIERGPLTRHSSKGKKKTVKLTDLVNKFVRAIPASEEKKEIVGLSGGQKNLEENSPATHDELPNEHTHELSPHYSPHHHYHDSHDHQSTFNEFSIVNLMKFSDYRRDSDDESKIEIDKGKTVPNRPAFPKRITHSFQRATTHQEKEQKKRRKLAQALQEHIDEDASDKIEKESLLNLSVQMNKLCEYINDYLYAKSTKDSEEVEEQTPDEKSLVLDHVKQWVAREFRLLEFANLILDQFFCGNKICSLITELRARFDDDEDFQDFDLESFDLLVKVLVDFLILMTKKNELNHLYNCQYVSVYLHLFLSKANKGLYSILPMNKFSKTRERIFSCLKNFLSDEDPSTLNQLNHYQAKIFEAITLEEDYKAPFLELLDIQTRSKAPNVNNKIIIEFIRKFLNDGKSLRHVFPQFSYQEGVIMVKFCRYSGNVDLNYEYTLQELFLGESVNMSIISMSPVKSPKKASREPIIETLAAYIQKAFNLIEALSQLDDMLFSFIIMKYYPFHILQRASEELATINPQISYLIKSIISSVHLKYVKPPLQGLPTQIKIIADDSATWNQINETLARIKERMGKLISDIEWEVIKEREVEEDVKKSKEVFENNLEEKRPGTEAQMIEISEHIIQKYEKICANLIEAAKTPDSQEAKEAANEAFEFFSTLETMSIKYVIIEILEEVKAKLSARLKGGDDKSLSSLNTTTDSIQTSQSPSIPQGVMDFTVISDIIKKASEKWKNPNNYLRQSHQNSDRNDPTKNLDAILFNLLSIQDPTILKQIVSKLRWVACFENNIYRELKKTTIINDLGDLTNLTDVLEILFTFSEYSRIFKIPECFGKPIPENRIKEIFVDIDNKINRLLFIIYNPKKHFRYPEWSSDCEERFLTGFRKWKSTTKDKPFKINPDAVNQTYQKIYLAVDIPKILFQIIEIAVSIKGNNFSDEMKDYLLVIRKAVIILQIIIYKNTENQSSLAQQRFMISNLYNVTFTNQTCDFMILFSEMMRGNRKLIKMPMKYLSDITWSAFINTFNLPISSCENHAYLCSVLMSLHFVSRVSIGGKDPYQLIAQKFSQMVEVLTSTSNGLDIFELGGPSSPSNLKEETGQVIDLPYHYYSIRELLSSWIEIKDRILKDRTRIEKIFGQFKATQWYQVLSNPSLIFQFEIRNLVCKTLTCGWYGGKYKLKAFEKFSDFMSFVFRLFADISAFITFISSTGSHKELNHQLEIQSGTLFSESSMVVQMQSMLDILNKTGLSKARMQIYIEDIELINLWKEYIYDGCIGLLNVMLLEESNHMTDTIDFTDQQFPNLISYYLYLLEKVALIPVESKQSVFRKIEEDLTKVSLLPEYKSFKDKLLKVAQMLKEVSPNLKSKLSTSRTKFSTEIQVYEENLNLFLKKGKQVKEANIRKLADTLASLPDHKKIIKEIITFLKTQYNNLKSAELSFLMKLLRKFIERENTRATADEPVHTWESVNISDLQKMTKIQGLYRELGLTKLLVNIALDRNQSKIMIEFLQLGLAYLYGGNSEVQEEYFQLFRSDYDNQIITILRNGFEKHANFFKEFERIRIKNLYQASVRYGFEYLEELREDIEGEKEKESKVKSQLSPYEKDEQMFSKVRESFNEELFIDTQEMKSSKVLILILSFIQGLVDKQCKNLQDFFRHQRYIDDKGEERVLANSFNFLAEFRSLFNAYYKVHCIYNNTVGDKILDVLTEFLQGDVQENMESLLNKTLLYDMCRLLTDFNNPIHLLPRGFGPNPYTGEFQTLKSRVIQFLKTLAEYPDLKILQRVEKHLDLSGLLDVYEAIMYEFFGWDMKKPPQQKLYAIAQDKINNLNNEDYDGILMDGQCIYIIFRYLWEDPVVFEKNIQHLISESDRDLQKKEILEVFIFFFSAKTVRGVEILMEDKQKDLIKYWFPKLPVCNYLLESSKQTFNVTVDRSNTQAKISSLMEAAEEFIPQMHLDYNSRRRFLGLNLNQFYAYLRVFVNMISIAINILNIATLRFREGTYEFQPAWGETLQIWLNVINFILAINLIAIWLLTSRKRYLRVMWERFSEAFSKEMGVLPQTIERKLDEERYNDLDKSECMMILKFKGIDSEEFALVQRHSQIYSEIQREVWIQSFKFAISSPALLWHTAYFGLSVGSFITPIFSAMLIADIAVQSDAIGQVIKAVLTNWRQFLWTLFLLIMFALIYTFIGFYMLQDEFKDNSGHALCQDALGCFLAVINLGLRSGGGIADAIQLQSYNPESPQDYFWRVIFSLAFFITMITILLNLIFGMIIDAFGDLRDTKTANEEDAESVCFICGIERSEFERYTSFDDHVNREHNYWSYIYLLVYIQEKFKTKRTLMTGLENFVNERFRVKDYSWMPVGRSLTLERLKEAQGSKRDESSMLQETVKNLSMEVKTYSDKINNLKAEITQINETQEEIKSMLLKLISQK